jgi:hypothetical protein
MELPEKRNGFGVERMLHLPQFFFMRKIGEKMPLNPHARFWKIYLNACCLSRLFDPLIEG